MKFIISQVSTPCHSNYTLYLLWVWNIYRVWILQDRSPMRHMGKYIISTSGLDFCYLECSKSFAIEIFSAFWSYMNSHMLQILCIETRFNGQLEVIVKVSFSSEWIALHLSLHNLLFRRVLVCIIFCNSSAQDVHLCAGWTIWLLGSTKLLMLTCD